MTKHVQSGTRKAAKAVAHKARAGRSASVTKQENLTRDYVNGATRSATEIGKLVHDLLCRDAAEMHFDVLRKQVSQFKNSEEGRHTMCKAMERIAELNKAEGIAEGEARGKREGKRESILATAKRMLKDGILALKDVARYSGLSLAQVKKLQASMA